eukprot:802804-Amphidinium_carterae.1
MAPCQHQRQVNPAKLKELLKQSLEALQCLSGHAWWNITFIVATTASGRLIGRSCVGHSQRGWEPHAALVSEVPACCYGACKSS